MAVKSSNYDKFFALLLIGTFFTACLSADYRSTTSNLNQQRVKNTNSKSYVPSSSSYETLDEPQRHNNHLTTSSESSNRHGISSSQISNSRGKTGKYSTEYSTSPSTTSRRTTQSSTSTSKNRRRIETNNRNSNEDIDEIIRDTFSDEYLTRKEYSSSEYPVYISSSDDNNRNSRNDRNKEQRQSSQFADSFHGGMLYISNRKGPVSEESFEREANRDDQYQSTATNRKRGSQERTSNESNNRRTGSSSGSSSSESSHHKTAIQSRNSVDNCEFKICENDPNYPTERVLKLIKKNPELQYYFNVEIQVDNRNMEDEERLCRTRTITKFPQKAKNTRNEEKTIVNVDEYKQGFIMEYCEEENAKCKYADMFPLGRNPTCVQKFVTRRMMVVSEGNDNGLVFDNFLIPSCCLCTIKKQN